MEELYACLTRTVDPVIFQDDNFKGSRFEQEPKVKKCNNIEQEQSNSKMCNQSFRPDENFAYYEALAYVYQNSEDKNTTHQAINCFEELRGGGVATQVSMIFSMLFHEFIFKQIQKDALYRQDKEHLAFLANEKNV